MSSVVYRLSKRSLLKLLPSAVLVPGASTSSGNLEDDRNRQIIVASLNNALTQSLAVLGIERFGAAGLRDYARNVVEPDLPPGAIDIGTTAETNLELLAMARPRFILHSPEWTSQPSVLRRIAPVVEIPIYRPGTDTLKNARAALTTIGDLLDVRRAAVEYDDHVRSLLASLQKPLGRLRNLRFWALSSPGPRQIWSYGRGSLFDGVLRELGLRNALIGEAGSWGFVPIALKDLARMEDVMAIHLGPLPQRINDNPFWKVLPMIRKNRLVVVPDTIWMWGGLPSAARLARMMAKALEAV